MGCDIHFKIERRLKNSTETSKENKWNVTDYSIEAEYGNRDYWMFAHMANVRSDEYNENYLEPKGLPEDISDNTKISCSLLCPTNKANEPGFINRFPKYKEINRDQYNEWRKLYKPKVLKFTDSYKFLNEYYDAICDIDTHSHSWLTTEEYEECFNKVYKREENNETIYLKGYLNWYILLQRMKAYEEFGKYDVRIIFWFDN